MPRLNFGTSVKITKRKIEKPAQRSTYKRSFKNCKTDAVIIRILTDVSAMLPSSGYTRLNTVKKFVKISSRA